MSLPKIYHAKDVKGYLGISLNKTYQILETGELRGTKCGAKWLVTETALMEYLGMETDDADTNARVESSESAELSSPCTVDVVTHA